MWFVCHTKKIVIKKLILSDPILIATEVLMIILLYFTQNYSQMMNDAMIINSD